MLLELAAAWLIVYVFPAIVTEPLLAATVLASTVTEIAPVPAPLVDDRLTQERLSEAVHTQLEVVAVIEIIPVPPLEVKLLLVGEMLKVQDGVST